MCDITAEKHDLRSKSSPSRDELRHTLLLELPGPVFYFAAHKKFMLNKAASKLFGLDANRFHEENVIYEYFPTESRKRLKSIIKRLKNSPESSDLTEEKMFRKDGSDFYVEISLKSIADGDSCGVLALMRDMTSQKEMEDTIRTSENRYRTIFNTTGTTILCIEDDTTVSFVNSEFEKVTGYRKSQIENSKSWMEFVAEDDRERMLEYHLSRRRGKVSSPGHYEFKLKLPSGEYRNIYVTVATVPGSKQSIASLMDVTELRRAEVELAATQERYRRYAEATRDCIIVFKLDGSLEYINRAARDMCGMSYDEMKNHKITSILPYSKNMNLYKAIREKQIGSSEIFIDKNGFLHRDGENIEVEISSTVVYVNNEPESIVVVARDITDRRRLEREVLEISEKVRQQVGRDLHDDLSPHLIGVEALSEVLRFNLENSKVTEAAAAVKIQQLINEAITKTHRLARGLCPVDLDSTGLITALSDLAKRINTIYKKDCVFKYDKSISIINEGILAVNLYYIAHEAVNNSVKHSGANRISISLCSDESNLLLKVEDNGRGIKKNSKGSRGMGLRIMQYRAEIIKASLQISANDPMGTVLLCTIPLMHVKQQKGGALEQSATCKG